MNWQKSWHPRVFSKRCVLVDRARMLVLLCGACRLSLHLLAGPATALATCKRGQITCLLPADSMVQLSVYTKNTTCMRPCFVALFAGPAIALSMGERGQTTHLLAAEYVMCCCQLILGSRIPHAVSCGMPLQARQLP
jgi:hypothetical protein